MADVNYSNPFSAMPTQQQYKMSTPYGTYDTPLGMQAGNTQLNASMPALDMALQGQGMDLAKQKLDMQEYQSADATEQRKQKRVEETRKSIYEAEKAKSDQSLIPALEDQQRANLHQKYNEIIAKPEGQFVQQLAHAYPGMKDMPPPAQALVHRQMVEQWQRANPDKQLPPGLANFSGDTMNVAKAGYQAELNSAEHMQAQKIEQMKADSSARVAGIGAGSAANVANINNQGAAERATADREYGKQRLVTARRLLSDPKASSEQKSQANAELADAYHDPVIKGVDARIANDITMINMPPAQKEQKRAMYYIQEMAAKGVKLPMSVWRQTMPGASDSEIKMQAKKAGLEIAE